MKHMDLPSHDNDRFTAAKRGLQVFQAQRLKEIYSDVVANPEYTRIGRFFFEKLYAPDDFSFRNASIRKLHKVLDGKVYQGMVAAVSLVIELHDLSDELDERMACQMLQDNVGPDLTMKQYRQIYKSLDNYDQRVYQIQLATRTNRAFHRLSKMWIVGVSLKTVRLAAHMLGMGRIMDFVHEGYVAFKTIDKIDDFVQTIECRELAWHKFMWNGNGQPFKVPQC